MSGVRTLSLISACSVGLGAVLGSTYERRRKFDLKSWGLPTRPGVFPSVDAATVRISKDDVDWGPPGSVSSPPAPVRPSSGPMAVQAPSIATEIMRLGLPVSYILVSVSVSWESRPKMTKYKLY